MMTNYHNYRTYVADNQREKLAAAAQHRLAQTSAPQDERSASVYKPLLARMGRALIKLGTRLQVRYGSLNETSHRMPLEPNSPAHKPSI